jgi:CheY-like chemotaxis protein
MTIVLFSTDLMLASTAQGAAARHGANLIVAAGAAAAIEACRTAQVALVAVDLRTPGLDLGALVPAIRAASTEAVHVLACAPHVHEASLAAAAAAKCDEVVTRGEFERRFDAAVARWADA